MFEAGKTVDVSLKHITIGDLAEYYGRDILNYHVCLFANDDGILVDGFKKTGILKDIINDENYGLFYIQQKVLLIEKDYTDDTLYIDFQWNNRARKKYIESTVDTYAILNDEEYKNAINYLFDADTIDDFISRCKEISDNIINKLSNMTVKNILDNKSDVCYNNNCKIVKFEKRKR